MRRLALLFLLVPFAALWIYGCDESLTEVQEAAAEAPEGSDTPLYAPKEGPDKRVSGLVNVIVTYASARSIHWETGMMGVEATCPPGKVPITCGGSVQSPPGAEIEYLGARVDGLQGTQVMTCVARARYVNWLAGPPCDAGTPACLLEVSAVCADAKILEQTIIRN